MFALGCKIPETFPKLPGFPEMDDLQNQDGMSTGNPTTMGF
jgi:hypothetical protein